MLSVMCVHEAKQLGEAKDVGLEFGRQAISG